MAARHLSLIMPAYKQERTIVDEIRLLSKVLSTLPHSHEVIVVVDGFEDDTYKKLKKIKSRKIRVFGYRENKGKGFAIKYGVEKAKGDIIGFIDAGMDLDPAEISIMLDLMEWKNAHIVVGSKLHPDSKVNYPRSRKILSWGYRTIVKILFRFDVNDTQVGLKVFRKNVAKDVFPRIVVKRFAFDVEVLAVARMRGYKRIYEAPIKLDFKQGSITNSNFWKIAFLTLWDTLAVFYRMNILHYYNKK